MKRLIRVHAGLLCLLLAFGSSERARSQTAGQPSPNAIARRVPGRPADAHQPRIRVVHPGRRQPQRQPWPCHYRKKGDTRLEAGAAAAAPAGRAHLRRVAASTSSSPNMFAGSILDLEPDTAYEAQFVIADPDGVTGETRRVTVGPHAPGAEAVCRRPRLPRLPARIQGRRKSSRRSKG